MLMPDQMHLFGCAQTSWSFWNSLCDYKANIYIYIYLVCKWEYVIHVFTAVNYVLYIYIW